MPPHHQPTIEALHVGTDRVDSPLTELEPPPKDFRGPNLPDSAGAIGLTGDSNDDEVSNLLRS
jgi:hypothetical protein